MSFLAGTVVALVLALLAPSAAHAQEAGTGLITAVDAGTRTLTLDTPHGQRSVIVAPTASVRSDGRSLAWADLSPGDAVAYQVVGGRVTRLEVAAQFWALPSGHDVPARAQR